MIQKIADIRNIELKFKKAWKASQIGDPETYLLCFRVNSGGAVSGKIR